MQVFLLCRKYCYRYFRKGNVLSALLRLRLRCPFCRANRCALGAKRQRAFSTPASAASLSVLKPCPYSLIRRAGLMQGLSGFSRPETTAAEPIAFEVLTVYLIRCAGFIQKLQGFRRNLVRSAIKRHNMLSPIRF